MGTWTVMLLSLQLFAMPAPVPLMVVALLP
jgi:hypothetical protein